MIKEGQTCFKIDHQTWKIIISLGSKNHKLETELHYTSIFLW